MFFGTLFMFCCCCCCGKFSMSSVQKRSDDVLFTIPQTSLLHWKKKEKKETFSFDHQCIEKSAKCSWIQQVPVRISCRFFSPNNLWRSKGVRSLTSVLTPTKTRRPFICCQCCWYLRSRLLTSIGSDHFVKLDSSRSMYIEECCYCSGPLFGRNRSQGSMILLLF